MSSGIGSVFELSLRILLLLNEVNEKLEEEQIGAIDFAAVYAADELDEIERGILTCLKENGKVSRSELEKYTKKSRGTVINRLNNLMEKGVVKVNGDIHDPTRTYELA